MSDMADLIIELVDYQSARDADELRLAELRLMEETEDNLAEIREISYALVGYDMEIDRIRTEIERLKNG